MALKRGDLKDTILPKVSVDEYEPKSGTVEEIIVVGFFLIDEDPAKDLDGFIDRGTCNILDADVSPNPNAEGHYMVFIEFMRDDTFFNEFQMLLKDIKNVAGDVEWVIITPENEEGVSIKDVSWKREISSRMELPPVEEFLESAYISNAKTEIKYNDTYPYFEKKLTIRDSLCEMKFDIIDFSDSQQVIDRNKLTESAPNLFVQSYEVRKLRSMLGNGWHVTELKESLAIHNEWDDKILLVRTI